ncbi:hypothetical protein OROMI_032866 [Orobanche minor]
MRSHKLIRFPLRELTHPSFSYIQGNSLAEGLTRFSRKEEAHIGLADIAKAFQTLVAVSGSSLPAIATNSLSNSVGIDIGDSNRNRGADIDSKTMFSLSGLADLRFGIHLRYILFRVRTKLKGLFIRVSLVIAGSPSVEVGLASVSFTRKVVALYRKSGPLFTALYLKQCGVALQRYYAGYKVEKDSLPIYVSLSRSGLPRIIPRHLRHRISIKDDRADYLVRLYLSWFSVAKIIKLAKPISKATFKSIITPTPDIDEVREVHGWMLSHFLAIHRKYVPWVSTIPLEKGLTWMPTWKSTPNDDRNVKLDRNAVPNIFTSMKYEVASFARDVAFVHSLPDGVFSPGILFAKRTLWPLDYKGNIQGCMEDLDFYESNPGLVFHQLSEAFAYLRPGRLAQVIEGAGKRRLFAIGNYVKQRLLRPVHDWAMKVLSLLPTDGTFNQEGPIKRLAKNRPMDIYSFYLSSATDRWPLSVIHEVFACFFGPTLASCVVNGCLGLNSFDIGNLLRSRPLVYPNKGPFTQYAILGDDIVIADKQVASQYRLLLDKLGVSISLPKSLISKEGALEFAKRSWVKGISKDLSPVSAQALMTVRSTVGLCQLADKYQICNPGTLFRLAGAGYRVRARLLSDSRPRKWERLWVASTKPLRKHSLPLEWWIGRGKPLNPYLKGIIVDMLRKELQPKELRLPPEKLTRVNGITLNTLFSITGCGYG